MQPQLPSYGRSGLLGGNRFERSITRRRFPKGTACKWCPSLLSLPQTLLEAVSQGESVNASILNLLRIGLLFEVLMAGAPSASVSGLAPGERAVTLFGGRITIHDILEWYETCIVRAEPCAGPVKVERIDVGGVGDAPGCPLPADRADRGAAILTSVPYNASWGHSIDLFVPHFDLAVVKEKAIIETVAGVTRQAVTLLGKEAKLADVVLAHPSCSSQHAAFGVNFVYDEEAFSDLVDAAKREISAMAAAEEHAADAGNAALLRELQGLIGASEGTVKADPCPGEYVSLSRTEKLRRMLFILWDKMKLLEPQEGAPGDGGILGDEAMWRIDLQVVDLGSTNGTVCNGERLQPWKWTSLIEGDVLRFGCSTRQYVVVRPPR